MLTLVGLGVWLAVTVGIPLTDPKRRTKVLSSEINTRNTLTLRISITPYLVAGSCLLPCLTSGRRGACGTCLACGKAGEEAGEGKLKVASSTATCFNTLVWPVPNSDNLSIEDKLAFVNRKSFIYALNLFLLAHANDHLPQSLDGAFGVWGPKGCV